MKNRFYILIAVVLLILGCSIDKIDKKKQYANGNYCFKYLGNKNVCFCGWSKEAVKQAKGAVYVPEKIYDFNVVEVGIHYEDHMFDDAFSVRLNDIKSIGVPAYIKTVRLDKYKFGSSYWYPRELSIPEGITDISTGALDIRYDVYDIEIIILPRSLKRIDSSIFGGRWSSHEGWEQRIKFQDPSNWYIKRKDDNSTWQPIDVSDPAINVYNLTETYSSYVWEKRP